MKAKDPLSYKVIGCAMEVYNVLGPGLLESVYEKALIHELQINGLSVSSQVPVEMLYHLYSIMKKYPIKKLLKKLLKLLDMMIQDYIQMNMSKRLILH